MKKLAFYFTFFPIFIFSFSNISSNIEPEEKNFLVYGDFLFWKTQESGLDFAYDNRILINNTGITGDIKRATYDWQSGFRVGFKYKFSFWDNWLLDGQYGHISPSNSQEVLKPENTLMSSTFQMPDNFTMQKATSKTNIRADFANLLLERYFYATSKMKLGISSGLSALWIKRDWTAKFYDFSNNIRVIKPTWYFHGAGLKTGLDFDWILKSGFYWVGKTSASLIFGNYDIWMSAYDLPGSTFVENSHLDDFRIVTNLQCLLGPAWQRAFNNFNLKIIANYEVNVFFNLSQMNRSLYQSATSNPQSRFVNNNLQMHGLTLYAVLNF